MYTEKLNTVSCCGNCAACKGCNVDQIIAKSAENAIRHDLIRGSVRSAADNAIRAYIDAIDRHAGKKTVRSLRIDAIRDIVTAAAEEEGIEDPGVPADLRLVVTKGNHKLDKSIASTSLFPVISCPNHKQCARSCYAIKAVKMYRDSRRGWLRNYLIARYAPDLYRDQVIDELERTSKRLIRIHVSGDFFNSEYVSAWIDIVNHFPDRRFWTYTKAGGGSDPDLAAALDTLGSLDNCNIIESLPLDRRNFGSEKYLQKLAADLDAAGEKYFVCPCNNPNVKDPPKCGSGSDCCNACAHYKYVLFYEH